MVFKGIHLSVLKIVTRIRGNEYSKIDHQKSYGYFWIVQDWNGPKWLKNTHFENIAWKNKGIWVQIGKNK